MGGQMKTCGTCKHWYDLWENNCCGSCDKLTEETSKYDRCRVYEEPITTEKNFGCIHWEDK